MWFFYLYPNMKPKHGDRLCVRAILLRTVARSGCRLLLVVWRSRMEPCLLGLLPPHTQCCFDLILWPVKSKSRRASDYLLPAPCKYNEWYAA